MITHLLYTNIILWWYVVCVQLHFKPVLLIEDHWLLAMSSLFWYCNEKTESVWVFFCVFFYKEKGCPKDHSPDQPEITGLKWHIYTLYVKYTSCHHFLFPCVSPPLSDCLHLYLTVCVSPVFSYRCLLVYIVSVLAFVLVGLSVTLCFCSALCSLIWILFSL